MIMFNYDLIAKKGCVEIYNKIDDFYKMHYECVIDSNINDFNLKEINDIFVFIDDMQLLRDSYECLKKELILNNINDYIIICDFEHEIYYIYDKETKTIYYIHDDFTFKNHFVLRIVENVNDKLKIQYILIDTLLNNEEE